MQSGNFVNINNRYSQAKYKLITYTVHFPKISTVCVMIAAILKKMAVKTVFYEKAEFNADNLNYYSDIIVNSDMNNWINNENCITINTWDYIHIRFDDFSHLIDREIVCEKGIDNEEHRLAVRAVCDMLYSVTGTLVF